MVSSPPLKSLTPELLTQLKEHNEKLLFEIISANSKSKFCQTADELSIFRNAVDSLHEDEQGFLRNFRELVPLTVYDAYQPFVTRFLNTPCQESEVIDLFAPGFPAFIAVSSATSGKVAKLFPRYKGTFWNQAGSQKVHTYHLTYRTVLNIFRGDQDIVQKIMVTTASAGFLRMRMGWNSEQDEDRMSSMVPGESTPYAVAMVKNHPSFLLLHALFALADRSVDTLKVLFSTTLLDMFMYMERDWSSLVDAIENGTIPELEYIEHVRDHLERHLHANPARAAELRTIGPPSKTTITGWAKLVWPNLKHALSVASGSFSSAVPKVKHILGPDVILQTPAYACSECVLGVMYQPGDLNRFRVSNDVFIEYLDVNAEEVSNNLCAAWEAEPGRLYEPIITTYDGLWRYRLGDVVELLGFAPDDGTPVVKFVERRKSVTEYLPALVELMEYYSAVIRFDSTFVTEAQLVQSVSSATQDTLGQVVEFTCFKDARELPSTVGFFVELANEPASLGASLYLAKQRLLDVLSDVNEIIKRMSDGGSFGMPTIRVVKPGTFAQYRKWKGEAAATGTSQVKVPVVMSDTTAQEWIMSRVELEI
ncbi:GH3 auxin-responsive promoter [Suillus clintonianus]|uniref:GH3 auxin-responsive promoter n=1 Tax=Suillus clintonianus TaxID=1904413 RepID=UPI001B874CE5|nr:GH3 auxin-responsive promoter [Suillus clintonianus]KAG2145879.1 GH3 auxin-responsive promoter [Suillus clintonianus]